MQPRVMADGPASQWRPRGSVEELSGLLGQISRGRGVGACAERPTVARVERVDLAMSNLVTWSTMNNLRGEALYWT